MTKSVLDLYASLYYVENTASSFPPACQQRFLSLLLYFPSWPFSLLPLPDLVIISPHSMGNHWAWPLCSVTTLQAHVATVQTVFNLRLHVRTQNPVWTIDCVFDISQNVNNCYVIVTKNTFFCEWKIRKRKKQAHTHNKNFKHLYCK